MKSKNSFLFWLPRILSILFILFIMMFSLDVFDGKSPIGEILIGFVIHNIPAFGMMILAFLAWRNDLIGAIGFGTIALVLFFLVSRSMSSDPDSVANFVVSGPALVIAALYLVNWLKSRKV